MYIDLLYFMTIAFHSYGKVYFCKWNDSRMIL